MVSAKILDNLSKLDTNAMLAMTSEKFVDYLVDDVKAFSSEKDVKMFILQYLSVALTEDEADFPIIYYDEDEEISEENRVVEDSGIEMLTDEFVDENLKSK